MAAPDREGGGGVGPGEWTPVPQLVETNWMDRSWRRARTGAHGREVLQSEDVISVVQWQI